MIDRGGTPVARREFRNRARFDPPELSPASAAIPGGRRRGVSDPRLTLVQVPPTLAARGKSAALNYALAYADQPFVAIYDADNRPEPAALRPLVETLVQDPKLGATIGVYRCMNRRRNLFTRLLNIEGIGFQWIVQAGRWELIGFAALPGTNYVIRRSLPPLDLIYPTLGVHNRAESQQISTRNVTSIDT